jgi:hypothetical protein
VTTAGTRWHALVCRRSADSARTRAHAAVPSEFYTVGKRKVYVHPPPNYRGTIAALLPQPRTPSSGVHGSRLGATVGPDREPRANLEVEFV